MLKKKIPNNKTTKTTKKTLNPTKAKIQIKDIMSIIFICRQIYCYYSQEKKKKDLINIFKNVLSSDIWEFGTNPINSVTWKKIL